MMFGFRTWNPRILIGDCSLFMLRGKILSNLAIDVFFLIGGVCGRSFLFFSKNRNYFIEAFSLMRLQFALWKNVGCVVWATFVLGAVSLLNGKLVKSSENLIRALDQMPLESLRRHHMSLVVGTGDPFLVLFGVCHESEGMNHDCQLEIPWERRGKVKTK